jgi:hypothetical protein
MEALIGSISCSGDWPLEESLDSSRSPFSPASPEFLCKAQCRFFALFLGDEQLGSWSEPEVGFLVEVQSSGPRSPFQHYQLVFFLCGA